MLLNSRQRMSIIISASHGQNVRWKPKVSTSCCKNSTIKDPFCDPNMTEFNRYLHNKLNSQFSIQSQIMVDMTSSWFCSYHVNQCKSDLGFKIKINMQDICKIIWCSKTVEVWGRSSDRSKDIECFIYILFSQMYI